MLNESRSSADLNPSQNGNSTDSNYLYSFALLHRPIGLVIFEAGTYILIECAALVGNVLVCLAMYRNSSLRRITNIFIASLALSDMLMASLCMPFSLGVLITGRQIGNKSICVFQAFFIYTLAGVSLYTMALTAVNRYYRVVKSPKYHKLFSMKRTITLVTLAWIVLGSFVALLLFVGWLHVKFQPEKASCVMFADLGRRSFTYFYQLIAFVLFFILPTAAISKCYSSVFKTVKEHCKKVASSMRGTNQNTSANVEEVKITRTLFAVVIAFAICWLPVILYEVVVICGNVFHYEDKITRSAHLIWLYFPSLSSALNPFIYGVMNKSYRGEFVRMLYLCCKQCGAKDNQVRSFAVSYRPNFTTAQMTVATNITKTSS